MATFVDDPQWMYNHPDGTSQVFETWERWTDIPFTDAVPSFVFHNPDISSALSRIVASVVALLILAGLTWLAIRTRVQTREQPA
jgi:hypothetical protein